MGIRTNIIQKLIAVNEAIFFYPKLRKFYAASLGKGAINILDVGANKGQSIDFFKGIRPDAAIDAFEPNKKLYQTLVKKYDSDTAIKLHNVGVSDINGELLFNENIMDETSTFETFNPESVYLEKKAKVLGVSKDEIIVSSYNVPVIRLSDFLSANGGRFFDVLKIDVEGHELNCLKGLFTEAKLPIRFIQLEHHNDDMYANHANHPQIEALLHENGFREAIKIKHGFGDFYEIVYENQRPS